MQVFGRSTAAPKITRQFAHTQGRVNNSSYLLEKYHGFVSESEIITGVIYTKSQNTGCAQKCAHNESKNESQVQFFLDPGKHNMEDVTGVRVQ